MAQAQEQKKIGQFRCNKCDQIFRSEREHREHNEKAHRDQAKGSAQGQSQHGSQDNR